MVSRSAMLLGVVLLTTEAVGGQKPPTLRDRALASHAESITMPFVPDIDPMPIADLTRGADLVVEGSLRSIRSYLSPDENSIYTDFEVVPTQIILDREVAGARVPGPAEPAIVTLFGGELMIENKKVTVVETNRLPLSTNGHFLMFLKRTPGAGRRYKLFGSTAGFFEVRKDRTVRSMIKGYSSEEVSGVRLEDIVGRIRTPHIK